MRVRAIGSGAMLADSDHTVVVVGNHYFLPGSVNGGGVRVEPVTETATPREG